MKGPIQQETGKKRKLIGKRPTAEELLPEIILDARKKVDEYIRFETSAQQRALAIGSVYLTSATAIVAAVAALASGDQLPSNKVIAPAASCFLLFLIGAAMCFAAAFPNRIQTAGNTPEWWEWQIENANDLYSIRADQLDDLRERIKNNSDIATKTRLRFKIGVLCGLAAPLVGSAIWLWTYYSHLVSFGPR